MTEVTTRLADLGHVPLDPASPGSVEEDVARGRQALHRRRTRFGAAALVAGVGFAGGAVAISSDSGTTGHALGIAAASHLTTVPPSAPNPVTVKLVAYTGQEPAGFHIGTIPQGFNLDLQASTPNEVLIAPVADTDTSPDSFEGKLAVTAEAASELGGLSSLGSSSVIVGQHAGRIGDDGTATQVWWQVGSTILDVQCWDAIGLTHAQVVDFAASVSMTSQAQLSHG